MVEKRRRSAPPPGDVFELATPDGQLGYGLVIEGGGVPYIAILRRLHGARPKLDDLKQDEVALVGWTMDAWFYHGRWPVVGHLEPSQFDIPYPNYIVDIGGGPHATNYKGEVLGPALPEQQRSLDPKRSRSPVGYQNAFLALHGYRDWDGADDKLLAEHARRRMIRP